MSDTPFSEVAQKVFNLIADKNDVSPANIRLSDRFREELNFDSLDQVELSMEIEKEFNIALTDHEMESIVTVQNAVTLVESRIKK